MDVEVGQYHQQTTTSAESGLALRSATGRHKLRIALALTAVVGTNCTMGYYASSRWHRDSDSKGSGSFDSENAESTMPVNSTTYTTSVNGSTIRPATSNDSDDSSVGATLNAILPQSILESYSSCNELITDLKSNARLMGNAFHGSSAYIPWTATQEGAKTDMTQSNGVDIFVVYGREIVVLTAATLKEKSRTNLDDPNHMYCGVSILGLLLVEDSLVVFTETTCGDDTDTSSPSSWVETNTTSNVLIYEASTMELRHKESLNGAYISSRAVGTNVIVASVSYIDTYLLRKGLYQDNDSQIDEASFRANALAQLELNLDSFVESLVETRDCTSLLKVSLQNTNGAVPDRGYTGLAHISSFSVASPTFCHGKRAGPAQRQCARFRLQ